MTRILKLFAVVFLLALQSGHAADRKDFPGAWYADALPNGDYAATIGGSHVETSAGRVELPQGQNLLYVRAAPLGRLAGVGHRDDRAYERIAGAWIDRGFAHGVNAVIFNAAGELRVATPAVGSQGYRYLDNAGRLWTGDETYADPRRHLWEFSCHENICCGQGGDEEGLQCLIGTRRVLVEPGVVRFVRFSRHNDLLALAWTAPLAGRATVLFTSVAELNALPTYTLPGSTPPPPVPAPPPAPVPQEPSSLELDVHQAFDGEPRPITKPRVGELLNLVAWKQRAAGWGLLQKPSGNNCPTPQGVLVSCDILMHGPSGRIYDVLADSEGAATPGWGEAHGSPADRTRFLAPTEPNLGPIVPTPVPAPIPAPSPQPTPHLEDTEARARIAALESLIIQLRVRIQQLEEKPEPTLDEARVKAIVDEQLARYRFKVVLGRTWGHSHDAQILVEMVR